MGTAVVLVVVMVVLVEMQGGGAPPEDPASLLLPERRGPQRPHRCRPCEHTPATCDCFALTPLLLGAL